MGRVLNADGCEHLLSLAQNRHEVIRGVGQGCVVQGSVGFGHVDGLATHLNHQGLRDGQEGGGAGHREARAVQPLQVHGQAREGHGRVNGQANGA